MLSNVRKLQLLSWKYLYYRLHYWMITVVEILLPLVLTFLALRVRQYIVPTQLVVHNATIRRSTDNFLFSKFPYETVYYTPDAPKYNDLLAVVKRSVKETGGATIDFIKARNEKEIVLNLIKQEDKKRRVAAIIFLQFTESVLKYKIRDKNLWNTNKLFIADVSEETIPYISDPYLTNGFAALQSAINYGFFHSQVTREGVRGYKNQYKNSSFYQSYYQPLSYPEYTTTASEENNYSIVYGFMVVVISLIFTCPLIISVISEKENGSKERLKIAGFSEILIWLGWFLNSLLLSAVIYTLVTVMLKFNFYGENSAGLLFTEPTLLWWLLILYQVAQIAFCFMFCALFHSATAGAATFCLTTLTISVIALKMNDFQNLILVHLSCFFPPGAVIQAFIRINYLELLGQHLGWTTILSSETSVADASIGFVICMLIVDIILYTFLTFYITEINPGRFGSTKPWYFIFESFIRKSTAVEPMKITEKEAKIKTSFEKFTEQPVKPLKISLIIENLQKRFEDVQVVRSVNLTAYKDQILVLVGPKGAGKSTTIYMLTGSLVPTRGSIFYKRTVNVLENIDEFRKGIGFCPQENQLIPYMSVMNHLLLFGELKTDSVTEAKVEATEYLQLLNMSGLSAVPTTYLAKTMKKKLSLLIALMGKSEILILDEPTNGVDELSKPEIWNLLKELRADRTIIMTSYTIDEVEKIADRIAVINHGVIVCSGSVDFLKKTFGVGYEITIQRKRDGVRFSDTLRDPSEYLIEEITATFRGARLENRNPTQLVFFIPQELLSRLPEILKFMHAQRSRLNIENIGVSYATLDYMHSKKNIYDDQEILMKKFAEFETHTLTGVTRERMIGTRLTYNHYVALLWKKYMFFRRDSVTFILRVILPTLFMMVLIRGTIYYVQIEPLVLDSSLYKNSKILLLENDNSNFNFYSSFLNTIQHLNLDYEILHNRNIITATLNYAKKHLRSYRRDVIAAYNLNTIPTAPKKFLNGVNYTFVLSQYNTFIRHSLPVLVNLFDTILFEYVTNNKSFKMITINHPIRNINVKKYGDKFNTNITEQSPLLTVWYFILAFFTVDLLDYFIILVKLERIDGFKYMQYLSSVSPFTYWLCTFVFDFALFFTIVLMRVFLFKPFDEYDFFTPQYHMLMAFLLFTLFIISGLLFMYVVSFLQTSKYESYIFFIIFNLFCSSASFGIYKIQTDLLSGTEYSRSSRVLISICYYLMLLIPPLNFSLAFVKLIMGWRVDNIVDAYAQQGLPFRLNATERSDFAKYKLSSYLETATTKNPNGILLEVVFLIYSIFFYALLLYCTEIGLFGRILDKILLMKFATSAASDVTPKPSNSSRNTESSQAKPDDDVPRDDVGLREERARVKKIANILYLAAWKRKETPSESTTPNVLLANDLTKIHLKLFRPDVVSAKEISFIAEAGECFGLLGYEGAGKTSVLQMFIGSISITSGEAWIKDKRRDHSRTSNYFEIGYCPEKGGLLHELTGREILEYIATLRGVQNNERRLNAEKWMRIFDLEAVQNKKCGIYNETNQRKLCTALALIAEPSVVFLDEPTKGLDSISQRNVYKVINECKATGQIILLSSCNLNECQSLCDRSTLLVNGKMRFIGTIQDLRAKLSQSFTLEITLRDETETGKGTNVLLENITRQIASKFSHVMLKERKVNTLYYEIKQDNLVWFYAFETIESIVKKNEKYIMEYRLKETSFENIYNSFYKEEN